jgi:lysyl-tRNA synthetase class II
MVSRWRKTMALVGSVRRIVAALMVLAAMAVIAHAQDLNDYPTSARVEYVFGCLKANGETRQAIEQCSCSIDVLASLLPYQRYVTAETVLSMSQVRGDMGSPFRTSEQAASALNDLRRAQAEAEVRCF